MEQLNIFDWIDQQEIIKQLPPAQGIEHRAFIIEQLKPFMKELEGLELIPFAVCEALAFYQNHFQEKGAQAILNPKGKNEAKTSF